MLTWAAVPYDGCQGAAEQVVAFAIFLFAFRVVGWQACGDGQCPVYSRGPWQEVAIVTMTQYPAPAPPLGGVDWWRVEQIDAAGNGSWEPCP